MDLMKWIQLWEKCPELRPSRLKRTSDCDQGGMFWVWILSDGGDAIDDDDAAALIRDKAVWWLAKRHKMQFIEQMTNGEWVVCYERDHDDYGTFECGCHDDPTEALYLACCKVLGMTP